MPARKSRPAGSSSSRSTPASKRSSSCRA
jgi:hypothetical protein